MKDEMIELLDSIIGKTFDNGAKIFTVEKWKPIGGNVTIYTNQQTFVLHMNEVMRTLHL